MRGFSSSFLVFFYQIALGGLIALAGTPFHEIERAFYKSTAAVLYVIALLGLWGKMPLYFRAVEEGLESGIALEIVFHAAFVLSFTSYMVSLWTERQVFRARSFALSVLTGIAGLLCSAQTFSRAPLLSVETVLYPAAFFLSALLLGSVTVGMLIGHWYLIDTGQSLDPFIRIFRFFVTALVIQSGFFLLAAGAAQLLGTPETAAALHVLAEHHVILAVTRVFVGQGAPLLLSWMIHRTLQIPHTMAATGLFYIALLSVFVGEILGRQIMALTGLPF